jgi:hypothetical protein
MGDVFDFEALMPGAAGEEGAEEAEGEEVPNLHSAASEGACTAARLGPGRFEQALGVDREETGWACFPASAAAQDRVRRAMRAPWHLSFVSPGSAPLVTASHAPSPAPTPPPRRRRQAAGAAGGRGR